MLAEVTARARFASPYERGNSKIIQSSACGRLKSEQSQPDGYNTGSD